jgi:asparagine synthase (glutamine-hydrolysing)
VALMQAQSSRPVQTFSIGFQDRNFDEAPYAKSIAAHLNTDHTEVYVTPAEAQAVIPRLPEMYDEPFADSSQIPTFLVSQVARRHVTVSLSGDGGDELFGGYPQYRSNSARYQMQRFVPRGLRPALGRLLHAGSSIGAARTSRFWRNLARRMELEGRLLLPQTANAMYQEYISCALPSTDLVANGLEPCTVFSDPTRQAVLPSFVEQMMYFDTVQYLPDDVLTKVDRASMAVSLEARVPLLDHRVVEFAWRLPLSYRLRSGVGKWILRQVLYRYVPRRLVERPKKGFAVPLCAWLCGPLRDWAESLLDERLLRDDGLWNSAVVHSWWNALLAGDCRRESAVWLILMFQAWRNRWLT